MFFRSFRDEKNFFNSLNLSLRSYGAWNLRWMVFYKDLTPKGVLLTA